MSELPNMLASGTGAQPMLADRAAITTAVQQAISRYASAASDASAAFKASRDENERAIGEREAVLTELAALADAGKWSGDDLDAAVSTVLKNRNGDTASISTFGSEIKRCCRVAVRAYIPRYFKLAREAWDAEGEMIKNAPKGTGTVAPPKPLREAFARCYHLVVNYLAKEAADGRYYATAGELNLYAIKVLRDREIDPVRVLKRLAAIRKELSSFAADFPIEGITDCIEYLKDVSAADVKACAARAHTRDVDPGTPEPAPVANEPEPAQGPSELLNDALRDMNAA